MRIRQLPAAVANQIAAGEVIERPASVVKELLENSLDAGASEITIEIGYGGLNQIKISDNGAGIIAEDLPLAIAAHATSKISKLDDLYAIASMGFRGEALASIASIAKLSICSRPKMQEHAMMLKALGTEFTINPSARSLGTTVDVIDIFYNAPVRKRFLKSEKIEFQTLELVVKRFALSSMHIALCLKHNGKVVLTLPAATNEQAKLTRITKIFGSAFLRDAVYLDVEHADMRLCGYLSGPEYQRSQNDRMWVYINQRMVKDKLITHALKQAYDGILHPGRFPACLLYFSINTKEVDVNVHPTKHEVRFTQARLVHDFITSSINKALQEQTIKEPTTPYTPQNIIQTNPNNAQTYPDIIQTNPNNAQTNPNNAQTNPNNIQTNPHNIQTYPHNSQTYPHNIQTYPSRDRKGAVYIQLNKTYALALLNQTPHLIDTKQLYQNYLHHHLKQTNPPLKSRPLLVPIKFPICPELANKLPELTPILRQIGIEFDTIDKLLIIRTIPIQTPHLDLTMLSHNLLTIDSTNEALQLLSKSQNVDFQLLSVDEREDIEHYLLTINAPWCKPITEHDCKVLMDV